MRFWRSALELARGSLVVLLCGAFVVGLWILNAVVSGR